MHREQKHLKKQALQTFVHMFLLFLPGENPVGKPNSGRTVFLPDLPMAWRGYRHVKFPRL